MVLREAIKEAQIYLQSQDLFPEEMERFIPIGLLRSKPSDFTDPFMINHLRIHVMDLFYNEIYANCTDENECFEDFAAYCKVAADDTPILFKIRNKNIVSCQFL